MDDHKLLTECYSTMYQGMVQKNEALLDKAGSVRQYSAEESTPGGSNLT